MVFDKIYKNILFDQDIFLSLLKAYKNMFFLLFQKKKKKKSPDKGLQLGLKALNLGLRQRHSLSGIVRLPLPESRMWAIFHW